MKLYLAHPFEMRHEIREWELEFEKRTGIELVNPFYDVNREDMIKFDEGLAEPRTIETIEDGMYIVDRDLHIIENCDAVVAIIEKGKESFGTPMEFFYSSRILRKPTFAVAATQGGHPWIRGLATEVFQTTQDFENFVVTIK